MTIQELSRYYNLKDRLSKNQEILDSLKAKAVPGTSVITGMPHATGINDKVSFLGTEIAYMEEQIEILQSEIKKEKQRLEIYIDSIDDERVNVICRLRFLHCMTWSQVAGCMGQYYTESGVRKLVAKYLQKHATTKAVAEYADGRPGTTVDT